jgi:hypothetical protein
MFGRYPPYMVAKRAEIGDPTIVNWTYKRHIDPELISMDDLIVRWDVGRRLEVRVIVEAVDVPSSAVRKDERSSAVSAGTHDLPHRSGDDPPAVWGIEVEHDRPETRESVGKVGPAGDAKTTRNVQLSDRLQDSLKPGLIHQSTFNTLRIGHEEKTYLGS